MYHCVFAKQFHCREQFFDAEATWKHAKLEHSGMYFPWVCALCERAFFVSETGFIKHWRCQHSEYNHAKDVVHPEEGSHYSHLSVQYLNHD